MTVKEGVLIGELSRRVNLPAQTIRYYERCGLLQPPKRTSAQYRVYSPDDEERLRFIQNAKQFKLSLNEIKQLIELRASGTSPCLNLKDMVKQRLDKLDQCIQEMHTFREELALRYQQIEELLPSHTIPLDETSCPGKICGIIERSGHDESSPD